MSPYELVDSERTAESFFATLKKELVHGCAFETRSEAYDAISDYVENYYDAKRRRSAAGNTANMCFTRAAYEGKRMFKPILNVADVPLEPRSPEWAPTGPAAERFEARTGVVGSCIGAKKLGYNITAVPPGKRAWPFHNHPDKEEMFFVLHGRGEVRIGQAKYPIREGDIIACPAGGRETAHQIINTGTEELRYLAVSTEHTLEMAQYPDSGKFAVKAELRTAPDGTQQQIILVGREALSVDFWADE